MKHFFTQAGAQKLRKYCHPQSLLAFDYDGTLTPITRKISKAKLPLKTKKLLQKLYKRMPIAIVSGRSISDLKKLCSFSSAYFIGNHGLEGIKVDQKLKTIFYKTCKKWKWELIKKGSNIQGVELEDKKYSLSIHYRCAPNKPKIKNILLKHVSELHPSPRIVCGKCVIDLIPSSKFNKGISLKKAMHQVNAQQAIYIGDDQTDEDVFRLPLNSILKIRVGKKMNSRADFYIQNQIEINKFLNLLLEELSTQSSSRL